MHFSGIVVGDDIDKELEPYANYIEVEPYKVFLDQDQVQAMAEHYKINLDNLQAMCDQMKDWFGEEGFIENSKLGFWSRSNTKSKFDWYKIGGRCNNYLQLRNPRKSFWSFLGAKFAIAVNQAIKEEIDIDNLKEKDPLHFILINGQWHEDGQSLLDSLEGKVDSEWQKQYREIIDSIPLTVMITIVDIHS